MSNYYIGVGQTNTVGIGTTVINSDGAYINECFDRSDKIFTESTTSTTVTETWVGDGGASVAAGCGRVVSNGRIYNLDGDLISSSIASGTVAVGCNRIVSVATTTQVGYIYNLDGTQLATFTPFLGGPIRGASYTINETDQNFGVSVSVGCGRIVVGANLWDGPTYPPTNMGQGPNTNRHGSVYIYDLDGNPVKKIESPYYPDGYQCPSCTTFDQYTESYQGEFGHSVAVGNGRIIVGAPEHEVHYGGSGNIHDCGRVFIYDINGTFLKSISPDFNLGVNGSPEFGYSVAIGSGRIVVGIPGYPTWTGAKDGRAAVYDRNGNFITMLSATSSSGYNGDRFGHSVAIKNDIIAVGAPYANAGGVQNNGHVFVYNLRYYKINTVQRSGTLVSFDDFGSGVSIGSNRLVVGRSVKDTKVYAYNLSETSNSYWENMIDGYGGNIFY